MTLVHDVIPLTHPEFARPNGAVEHAKRMRTIDHYADGIIGNSQATLDAIAQHVSPKSPPGHPRRAPGGGMGRRAARARARRHEASAARISFASRRSSRARTICSSSTSGGDWSSNSGPAAPRLILVGRRGWENENVIDVLERSAILFDHVEEAADVSDRQLDELLAGARAVLIPSFAEGYGMPVAEALAAGVPVIASDIESLREVGGDVPEYLDPIDGLGWLATILDYAQPESARRDRAARSVCSAGRRWGGPTTSTSSSTSSIAVSDLRGAR